MMLSNTKNQSNRSAAVDARPIQKVAYWRFASRVGLAKGSLLLPRRMSHAGDRFMPVVVGRLRDRGSSKTPIRLNVIRMDATAEELAQLLYVDPGGTSGRSWKPSGSLTTT
jgi:hypothetical protein